MMTDTNIYGYVTDGAAWHPACLPDDINPAEDAEVSALFSWHDEDPHGLACDRGDGYIFEPVAPHPFKAPPAHADTWDSQCWTCGAYADDEELHESAANARFDLAEAERKALANREIMPDPLWRWD